MPVKTWEVPADQEDRERQPAGNETDQPRNLEMPDSASDANHDALNDASELEPINTHGSER